MLFKTNQMISEDTIITLFNFPGTEARKIEAGRSNGFVINYIDWKGNPDSRFIENTFWDAAREEFDNEVLHSVIISHYPAKMEFDFD